MAGTQEAGFLTSICPIQTFPAVIVIRNGMLQEYLAAGTAKDAFQARLKTAVSTDTAPVEPSPPVNSSDTTFNAESQAPSQSAGAIHEPAQAPIVPTPQPQTLPQEESVQTPPVSQLPTSQPIPAPSEASNRENIRAGKRPATHETPEQKKALQEEKERRALQAKLQREQKEQQKERERIRNQIKKDQEARKQRAAEEKNNSNAATSPGAAARSKKQPSQYRLQIRLFDGSSVRNSFPPSATIRKDVRPWLESQRSDGAEPYNLKHILTPLPNRTISVAEEERSLEELDLGPTASLVMVPVPSYIEAYAPTGVVNGLPGRVVSSGYGLVSGVVGGVAGMLGGFLGYGNATNQANSASSNSDSQQAAPSTASTTRTRSGINIRTINDQRNERDQNEFYNGNTVSSSSFKVQLSC